MKASVQVVRLSVLCVGAVLSSSQPARAQEVDEDGYEKLTSDVAYVNSRGGFRITIPALFGQLRQSTNGDGVHAGPADESFVLRAWACDNEEFCDFEKDWTRSSKGASYKVRKDTWFVVSGSAGGRIFYEKELRGQGVLATFRLEYPEKRKAEFDPVIATLTKSFSFVRDERGPAASGGIPNGVSRWQGKFEEETDPKSLHTVTLTLSDGGVSGSYFSARRRTPIALRGTRSGSSFVIDELSEGKVVATFKGVFDDAGTTATGTWRMASGAKTLTFRWTKEP